MIVFADYADFISADSAILSLIQEKLLWLSAGWIRPHHTTDDTRIRLYNCYILPVLLYNCGTWALTTTQLHRLESFHRRQLRSVLNVQYPRRLTNATLYEIYNKRPLRHRITRSRWLLFDHILRRPTDIPVYAQMNYLNNRYRFQTATDLEALHQLTTQPNGKIKWKELTAVITEALPARGDSTYADTTLYRRLAKLRLAQAYLATR
ncbi:hypothetical protein PHMEG_00019083 [Phytophthora megakarya]|uniref:Endonuclease-reverse transcriptase n=1 Tax=Phytophthora megakarya TaxID=4795 RepID=A0A225VST8_9STRA|nr:hypothetical protein PHMEG_00019083 [Phytophthora megakarya]